MNLTRNIKSLWQQQFQQDAENGMQKAQEEAFAPISQKLDNAIKAVGQSEGVIYIFDLYRTSIPYINESQSINLTNKVKTRLGISLTAKPATTAPVTAAPSTTKKK